MIFKETSLKGSYVLTFEPIEDQRGWLARTYCKNEFLAIGHTKEWVQMNHSFTKQKATVRGMHYQRSPYGEIKLVRCIAGAVYDVIIDLRAHSASYLQYFGIELSAVNKKMIYIPEGFAHGFQALSNDAELLYNHSQFYLPGVEAGVKYNDPAINIKWPLELTNISERDNSHPFIDANFKGL